MARGRPGRAQLAAGALAAAVLLAACSGEEDPATVTTTDQAGNTVVLTPTGTPTGTEGPSRAGEVPTTDPGADPVATTLPVPGETGTPAPPDDEAATTGEAVATVLTNVSVLVPAGWSVQDLGEAEAGEPVAGQVAPHRWCLVPAYAVPPVDGCSGVLVAVGGDWLPGAGGQPYEPGQVDGWRWGTEPLPCPFDPEADSEAEEPNLAVTDAEGAPLTTTESELNGMPAVYETWRVRCSGTDDAFTPQVWHVPELNVLIKDYFGQAATGLVLEELGGS